MSEPESQPSSRQPTRIQWLLLVGIVLLATLLRFIFIGSNEAFFDEVWHLELSTGRGAAHVKLPMNVLVRAPDATSLKDAPPWHVIYRNLEGEPHPPLHYVLLRFWRDLFGESLAVGRAMSAVFSILCVVVMFDVARQLHGPTTALWACLILALSSAQIEAAQEVRGYPLLILLSLVAGDALLRIEGYGVSAGRILALGIGVLGMLLTHYFALAAVMAMTMYAVVRLAGGQRRAVLGTIAASGLVFLLAWGPRVAEQTSAFKETAGPGAYYDPEPGHARLTFQRLAAVPVRMLFNPGRDQWVAPLLSGTLFIIPWLLVRRQPQLLFWAIWLSCIAGFIATIDLAGSQRLLTATRQTLLAGPAVCGLLAGVIPGPGALRVHAVPALLCLCCIGALGLAYDRPNIGFSWIGRNLTEARQTDEPVLFYSDPPDTWWSRWLFLGAAHYSGAFPRDVAMLDHPANQALLEQLHRWPEIWVVRGMTTLPPEAIVPGARIASMRQVPFVGDVIRMSWSQPPSASP